MVKIQSGNTFNLNFWTKYGSLLHGWLRFSIFLASSKIWRVEALFRCQAANKSQENEGIQFLTVEFSPLLHTVPSLHFCRNMSRKKKFENWTKSFFQYFFAKNLSKSKVLPNKTENKFQCWPRVYTINTNYTNHTNSYQ